MPMLLYRLQLHHNLRGTDTLADGIDTLLNRFQALANDLRIWFWLQRAIGESLWHPCMDSVVRSTLAESGNAHYKARQQRCLS